MELPREASGKEKRRFRRVGIALKMAYKADGETQDSPASSADVSAGGARLWLKKIIKKDSLLELKVYVNDDKRAIACVGKVIWQNLRPVKAGDGKYYYQTGVCFEGLDLKDRMNLIYFCHDAGKRVPRK